MRNILIILFAMMLAGCAKKDLTAPGEARGQQQVAAEEIQWMNTLSDGFSAARAGSKPLMVDFYADWCGWCRKLDSDVYTNAEVVRLSQKFVNVKVDTDKYGDDARTYGVQGLPTIVFLASDGSVIDRFVGYRGSDDFIAKMKEIVHE